MKQFNILYKILKTLAKAMDLEEFDENTVSAEALKISQPMWVSLFSMLIDNGYVEGAKVMNGITGSRNIYISRLRITLKGLEYLEENSLMKKASDIAHGLADFIP
ncbi:MAG: YjcQ family protein [Clostridium sp.]|jgi:hypothetical protein|nr:YjcQ family protein [Clostridium sp.]